MISRLGFATWFILHELDQNVRRKDVDSVLVEVHHELVHVQVMRGRKCFHETYRGEDFVAPGSAGKIVEAIREEFGLCRS